ncbi:MAG: hypothetical protein RLO37_06490 [Coleofasciculus chthonoplastes F1-TOW-03]
MSLTACPDFRYCYIEKIKQSTELLFAWVQRPNTPLILGQTNFFLEFDVCFYRSKLEFEVKPKSP